MNEIWKRLDRTSDATDWDTTYDNYGFKTVSRKVRKYSTKPIKYKDMIGVGRDKVAKEYSEFKRYFNGKEVDEDEYKHQWDMALTKKQSKEARDRDNAYTEIQGQIRNTNADLQAEEAEVSEGVQGSGADDPTGDALSGGRKKRGQGLSAVLGVG